jgi:hypothetical protein
MVKTVAHVECTSWYLLLHCCSWVLLHTSSYTVMQSEPPCCPSGRGCKTQFHKRQQQTPFFKELFLLRAKSIPWINMLNLLVEPYLDLEYSNQISLSLKQTFPTNHEWYGAIKLIRMQVIINLWHLLLWLTPWRYTLHKHSKLPPFHLSTFPEHYLREALQKTCKFGLASD